MGIVIEIQVLRVACTFRENAHGCAALEHEAGAFRSSIQMGEQPLLQSIANLRKGGQGRATVLRLIASLYDAISLNTNWIRRTV